MDYLDSSKILIPKMINPLRLEKFRYPNAFCISLFFQLFWGLNLKIPFSGDEPSYYLNSWAIFNGYGRDIVAASKDPEVLQILGSFSLHLVETPSGSLVSWHSQLMSLLLGPATIFSMSPEFARVLMAIYSSLGAVLFLIVLDQSLKNNLIKNAFAWFSIFALYPIASFGPLVFPDYLAGVFYLAAMYFLKRYYLSKKLSDFIFAVTMLVLLPWLGTKFIALMLPLGVFTVFTVRNLSSRDRVKVISFIGANAIAWFAFMSWFYSSFKFIKIISGGDSVQPGVIWDINNFYINGVGGWLSNEGGIIFVAPITLLGVIFLLNFLKHHFNKINCIFFLGIFIYYCLVSFFGSSGFSFVYRYFMPIIPFLVFPIAYGLKHFNWKKSTMITAVALNVLTVFISISLMQKPGSMLQGLPNSTPILNGYARAFPQTGPIPPINKATSISADSLPSLLPVERDYSGSIKAKISDGSGIVSYGPYIALQPGNWQVAISLKNSLENALTIEVVGNEYQLLGSGKVEGEFSGDYGIDFRTTHRWPNVQIRISTNGQGFMELNGIEFVPISLDDKDQYSDIWKTMMWLGIILILTLLQRIRKITNAQRIGV